MNIFVLPVYYHFLWNQKNLIFFLVLYEEVVSCSKKGSAMLFFLVKPRNFLKQASCLLVVLVAGKIFNQLSTRHGSILALVYPWYTNIEHNRGEDNKSSFTYANGLVWFVRLFGFHGISTFVGNLMSKAFLFKRTVMFQRIQFRISKQFNNQKYFYVKLFSLVKLF